MPRARRAVRPAPERGLPGNERPFTGLMHSPSGLATEPQLQSHLGFVYRLRQSSAASQTIGAGRTQGPG